MNDSDREVHKITFEKWARSISERDVDAFMSCFTDEAVIEDIALGKNFEGSEEIRGLATAWFTAFEDITLELLYQLEGDGYSAAGWAQSGTKCGEFEGLTGGVEVGGRYTKHGVSVFRFNDQGLFTWERSHWDRAELQRTLAAVDESSGVPTRS